MNGKDKDPCKHCADAAYYPDNCEGCEDYEPSPNRARAEVTAAIGEVAEFVYQAKVCGFDSRILDLMDVTDAGFNESLDAAGLLAHDDLRRIVSEEVTV